MIKNFIQMHKAILLTVVITAVATSAVASGYFVIKSEKKNANQKVETLQKSVEELQAKNEAYQEANKEPEKEIAVEETSVQQAPTAKKSVVVAPIKTEEAEDVEEKTVPCLTYADTTVDVSEAECEMIKQKNERSKEIDSNYQNCVSICGSVAAVCLPSTSRTQYDNLNGSGAYSSRVSECGDKNDDCDQDCLEARNDQMKKVWK